MLSKSSCKHLAILGITPLIRLGMVQFIQGLQLGYQCGPIISSVPLAQEKLAGSDVTALVAEVGGSYQELLEIINSLLVLSDHFPRLNIVVYTACRDISILRPLLHHRKFSLVAQQDSQEQLRQDLVLAVAGSKVCSPQLVEYLSTEGLHQRYRLNVLSKTERKVLHYLFSGLSMGDIARLCHRSTKTISAHKCNSMRKLGVRNDAELFQFAQHDATLAVTE